MDMVGDKQLTTQMSMQSETEVFQLSQGQAQADQDTTSCGGSGGMGAGDKELAGEYGNSSCNPSGVIVAGGDTVDSDVDTSKAESGVSMRSSNICGIVLLSWLFLLFLLAATNMPTCIVLTYETLNHLNGFLFFAVTDTNFDWCQ